MLPEGVSRCSFSGTKLAASVDCMWRAIGGAIAVAESEERNMKTTIKARGLELTEEVKKFIGRRVQFAVDRFAPRLRAVRVNLLDVNGPRGGTDKLCQFNAEIAGVGNIMVEEMSPDVPSAVALCARRLRHAIGQKIQRRRESRRHSGRVQ
jgi:ribosome-associated translation inhibitor RaiA